MIDPRTAPELILPVIHLGGSSRLALLEERENIAHALREALDAFIKNGPNQRDYYVSQDADLWSKALDLHKRRIATVKSLLREIEVEQEALCD